MEEMQIGSSTRHIGGRVPADLADAFEQFAEREDRTVSAELRRAMRTHLSQNGGQSQSLHEHPQERAPGQRPRPTSKSLGKPDCFSGSPTPVSSVHI